MMEDAVPETSSEQKEKFKAIKDPYGEGPFAFKQVGKAFELESKLKVTGKPVTLSVGGSK